MGCEKGFLANIEGRIACQCHGIMLSNKTGVKGRNLRMRASALSTARTPASRIPEGTAAARAPVWPLHSHLDLVALQCIQRNVAKLPDHSSQFTRGNVAMIDLALRSSLSGDDPMQLTMHRNGSRAQPRLSCSRDDAWGDALYSSHEYKWQNSPNKWRA